MRVKDELVGRKEETTVDTLYALGSVQQIRLFKIVLNFSPVSNLPRTVVA